VKLQVDEVDKADNLLAEVRLASPDLTAPRTKALTFISKKRKVTHASYMDAFSFEVSKSIGLSACLPRGHFVLLL
jgi:hypothetical protein